MPVLRNPRHEQFVLGLIEKLSATAAYIKAGYSKNGAGQSAEKLLKNTEIQARLKELQEAVSERLVEAAISTKEERMRMYADIQRRLWLIVQERGQDASLKAVPGGKSGFIVRQIKAIGSGATQKVVPEYSADVSLSREIRAVAEQAAMELGQWSEKHEFTGKDGGPMEIQRIERVIVDPANPDAQGVRAPAGAEQI